MLSKPGLNRATWLANQVSIEPHGRQTQLCNVKRTADYQNGNKIFKPVAQY